MNRREQYLDIFRDKLRSGAIKLTAALAKYLGLDFGDGAEMVSPLAYGKGV